MGMAITNKNMRLSLQRIHAALPSGYRVERNADRLALPRNDGTVVGYFSAIGVELEKIVYAEQEDAGQRWLEPPRA
jgi:hypothetical protein